jgi:hypothetical protein
MDAQALRHAVLGLGLGVLDAQPMRRNLKHGHALVVFVTPPGVDAQVLCNTHVPFDLLKSHLPPFYTPI